MENVTILINTKPHHLATGAYTGAQIKALVNAPSEYLLVLTVRDPDRVAGGDDQIIQPDQVIEIKSGMRFRVVSPATFG